MSENYWQNLPYPKRPNSEEVEIFKSLCQGRVLLLGETKDLRPLCHDAVDIEPIGFARQGDWWDIDGYWDTIIGDGVLNLVRPTLVDYLLPQCKRLVIRVFTEEIQYEQKWRYAQWFLSREEKHKLNYKQIVKGCPICIFE